MRWRTLFGLFLAAPVALLVSCGDDDGSRNSDDDDDDGTGGSMGTGGGMPTDTLVGVPGVTISQVAIYQGVKRTLMVGGAPMASQVPLIQGRDAVIRVFYTTDANYPQLPVTARLTIDGQSPLQVEAGVLAGASTDETLTSSVNFDIPGALIGPTFTYSVGLLVDGASGAVAENGFARYPLSGATEALTADGHPNTFRVQLAPFQYLADGSGRLPDTSAAKVEEYRQRFLQLYPVSNVEVTVRSPTPWQGAIQPNGAGWQEVGMQLFQFRNIDNAPDDLYYYGLFNPTATYFQFCQGGCLLGVTLLNDQPPTTGNVSLRLALGVGFDEVATDTAAHEIGHAHGRQHAPCAENVQPDGIDPQYPIPGGLIGTWGYDIVGKTLISPNATDVMGYCSNQWISEYNFIAIHNRSQYVNAAYWESKPIEYDIFSISEGARAEWKHAGILDKPPAGELVEVTLLNEQGAPSHAKGYYSRWDHIPGGWLFVPRPLFPATRAEFVVEGRAVVAEAAP